MAKLVWDLVGARQFEAGLDQGVFYGADGKGIAWNGLVSVDDDSEDMSVDPIYIDGIKVMDLVTYGSYKGKLKALTYPEEFLEYEGLGKYGAGVYLDDQPPKPFGLSYRTYTSNDTGSVTYKIHVLYGLTAIPGSVSYNTMDSNTTPVEFEWDLTGVPQAVSGRRPTVHFIFDSSEIYSTTWTAIEELLYGKTGVDPYLPDAETLLETAITIKIVDNGDGTWSATGPDSLITMLNATTFQIANVNGSVIDASNYSITTT